MLSIHINDIRSKEMTKMMVLSVNLVLLAILATLAVMRKTIREKVREKAKTEKRRTSLVEEDERR